MKIFCRILLPAFLLIPIVLLEDCKGTKDQSSHSDASPSSISNVSEVTNVAKRDGKAPNFSWKDSTGKVVDFDSFRGKLTLINFWATWCGPCKNELPALVDLSREYAGRGVKFIGISTDRGSNVSEDVRAFVHDRGIPYQIVVSNDDVEEAFGPISGLPTTFLVDQQGLIVQKFLGARDKAMFAQAIEAHLQ